MTTIEEIKEALQKNKKRLLIEVEESKELVFLVKKSVANPLTLEEKDKVKEQLLDICKAIPALAVFMLPGGALLLPMLLKVLPDILPSAFKEDI